MSILIRDKFWDAIKEAWAGLFAQSTTNPKKAVALQADEADGALHVKGVAGGTVEVSQVGAGVGGNDPAPIPAVTMLYAPQEMSTPYDHDGKLLLHFLPKVLGAHVEVVAGAPGSGVSVAGTPMSIILSVEPGVTVPTDIVPVWSPNLVTFLYDGDGTTVIDAAFPGASLDLWNDYIYSAPFAGLCALDWTTGKLVPLRADAADLALQTKRMLATPGVMAHEENGLVVRLPIDLRESIGPSMGTWHPLQGGVSLVRATGLALDVSAVGKVVTATVIPGTTTVQDVIDALAAGNAAGLASYSGTVTDTYAAGYVGTAEVPLWVEGPAPAGVLFAMGDDGYPWPAKSTPSGELRVSECDNAYKIVTVDLTAAQAAPGAEILKDGESVWGRNWTVLSITGSMQLKMNSTGDDAFDLKAGMSWDKMAFDKLYGINIAQPGLSVVLAIGRRV